MVDRVVIINDLSVQTGGASKLAIQSALAFLRRGVAVTLLSGDDGDNPELLDLGAAIVSLNQQRLMDAPRLTAMRTGLYNAGARALIADWIARNDTPGTVYHVHGWSQILSPAIFAPLRTVSRRTTITTHDFFVTCPNGALFDYAEEKPCMRVPMSLSCVSARCDRRSYAQKLWRVARQGIQNHFLDLSHPPLLLLIHSGMGPLLARSGVPESAMMTLPNPVTPFCATRVAAERNREVLFVGRMEATKGPDLAAEACRRAGVTLCAVGDGIMLETLRQQYPEMIFTGRLSPEAIGEHAARARLIVMPSRHIEPYGLAAVEGLWSGLPAIVTNESLITADIEAAGAGFGVDARDPDRFAATLRHVFEDDDECRRLSNNAFSGTSEIALTYDAWIQALLDVYDGLVAGETVRPRERAGAAAWQPAGVGAIDERPRPRVRRM